ncbi:MAG: 4-hydroxy-tetrahydrodipicolinate synthase [Luteibacter sp.]|uniref:dihydrodipicolinate synthase family protein n=1 Tax=Luteibacter sp. TaxID=1886636 RepID=UPI001380331A|nr:dihydrodipicolinate synthase family protein [Luteibacter sp.]KAF1006183.1 MAG: 4-hydroxy-tetrahydrodipicolinate synthase [Luteibacter sp.]
MFDGLSAFPLSPLDADGVDEAAYARLMARLVAARVDSIGALGSTGSYAYLTREERRRVAALAVGHADGIPVMVGIGATRTRDVLVHAEDAQTVGASAVLLAPVSYQNLTDEEVFGLFETVTRHLSVPLCVYDNPGTTRFVFSDELHARIARLPHVRSIKIPGVPSDPVAANQRVEDLRRRIPAEVTLGISGDACAARGMLAGCRAWYSVIGGLFPRIALAITRAAQSGDAAEAMRLSDRLAPLWSLFDKAGGSLRVVAAAAETLGLVRAPCLPAPLRAIQGDLRDELATVLDTLELD